MKIPPTIEQLPVPRLAPFRHAVIGAALSLALGVPAFAQSPAPMVVYQSFLETRFFLTGSEVALKESRIMLAFAPTDPFSATVRIKRGDAVLRELPARVVHRVATMAMLDYRATGVKLGPEEGDRTFEVVVNGAVAGRFDFTVRRRTTGDAFDPTPSWEVDGPWRTHLVLQYDPTGPAPQRIVARFWASTMELPSGARGAVELRGRRGTRTLFTTAKTQVSARDFLGFDVEAVVGANRTPWSADKLAGQEGSLTVELVHAGQVLRAFETRIESGGFPLHAHSAVPPADPQRFLSPRLMTDRGVIGTVQHVWITR